MEQLGQFRQLPLQPLRLVHVLLEVISLSFGLRYLGPHLMMVYSLFISQPFCKMSPFESGNHQRNDLKSFQTGIEIFIMIQDHQALFSYKYRRITNILPRCSLTKIQYFEFGFGKIKSYKRLPEQRRPPPSPTSLRLLTLINT